MTAADWASCTDPEGMLVWLRDTGRLTPRKARLFCVAVCRRIWHFLTHESSRTDVDTAEAYADGLVSYQALKDRQVAAEQFDWEEGWRIDYNCPAWLDLADRGAAMGTLWDGLQPQEVSRAAAEAAGWAGAASELPRRDYPAWQAAARAAQEEESCRQCDLIRDLFGDPFRPLPPLNPLLLAWNGGLIPQLAQAAYDDRQLPEGTLQRAQLAVLADALEESGHADAGLVEHLRGGLHYRGCHGIDAILGRE
jgi:hypothetical protein